MKFKTNVVASSHVEEVLSYNSVRVLAVNWAKIDAKMVLMTLELEATLKTTYLRECALMKPNTLSVEDIIFKERPCSCSCSSYPLPPLLSTQRRSLPLESPLRKQELLSHCKSGHRLVNAAACTLLSYV